MKILKIEDIKSYELGNIVCDKVWDLVSNWKYFDKDTVGKQFVRSADSIPANIAEGFGRFHYLDSIKFYYYARGSVYETQFWCKKSYKRNLINKKDYDSVMKNLRLLPKELNTLIKVTKIQSNK